MKLDSHYAAGIDRSIAGDENRGEFAIKLIEAHKPDFTTVYLTALDHEQHAEGPDSLPSKAVGQYFVPRHHQGLYQVKVKDQFFRKGHVVRQEDVEVLLQVGKEHLYVFESLPGMVHENDAAARIIAAVAGGNLAHTDPQGGAHRPAGRLRWPAAH